MAAMDESFGSLTTGPTPPSSAWSLTDDEVENRDWKKGRAGPDPDRDNFPCSASFDDVTLTRNQRRRRTPSDLDKEKDGGVDEWDIRASIGLDRTVDNDKESRKKTKRWREMVEHFFYGDGKRLEDEGQGSHLLTLLSGPPSCGKTSLLFQYAFNEALATAEGVVVFLCNRHRLETKTPFLSQGIDSSCDTFQRILLKYVDDDEGIKKYFAAFHLHDKLPVAVVIDDFGDFFNERSCQERYGNPRGRDLAMVRVLALCHSAIMHANGKGQCKLLISDTHHGDSPRSLFIYKRWISSILSIKGDGKGSFILRSITSRGSGEQEKVRAAKYSIALQYLCLEGIIED